MARHQPSVLLVGNGAPGQIGASFARALADLGHAVRFVDEARAFAPPAPYLALRAIDRLTRRQFEIRRFNRRILETARTFQPDVVLVVQGYHLWAATLQRLRESTRATLVCYSTDNPLVPGHLRRNVLASIPEYDVYASPRRSNLAGLAAHGCRMPLYLRFAYEPGVHFPEPPDTSITWSSDVVFIGGWDHDRVQWFDPLSRDGDVDMRLYGRGWSGTPLHRHAGGEIFGRSFRFAMAGAKVAPCLVRRSNGDGHSMRTFEIPACGAFMLAERTEEHLELFEDGVHAAYCETPEELRDKARFYITNESSRARIADAAHQLVTGRGHTYRDRMQELLSFVDARATSPRPRANGARLDMPVFIINLRRSTDRRAAMAGQCASLGIEPAFVDAQDGPATPQPEGLLSRSELGCLLSHAGIWQRIVRDETPVACILEDDCRLDADIVRLLGAIDRHRLQWDVALLGHHSSRHGVETGAETCYRGVSLDGRYRLAQVAEFAMGAYAYLVTLDGARKLHALAHPPRMPADWVTGYAPAAGARLFAVTPPCAWPDPELAPHTTMADRWAGATPEDTPPAAGITARIRHAGGTALLFTRKLGLRPDAYVKRF